MRARALSAWLRPLSRALLLAGALLAAAAAPAEVRRVELVGALAIVDPPPPTRQAVLEEAIRLAVAQVARDLAGGPAAIGPRSGTPTGAEAREWIARLGAPGRSFVVRYEALEDLGERTSQASGLRERAVLAEVHVDAGRVADALLAAGIAVDDGRNAPAERFVVEVRELGSWEALAGLRREMLGAGGASVAIPTELVPGRARLQVEAPGGPERLLERLLATPPEGLRIEPLAAESGLLVVRVRTVETPSPAFDTQH